MGVEAGLTADFVAYGVDSSLALAVALLYRFLTYWLPLIPGFVIFLLVRRWFLQRRKYQVKILLHDAIRARIVLSVKENAYE